MTARGTVASFARPRTRSLFASAVPVDPQHTHTAPPPTPGRVKCTPSVRSPNPGHVKCTPSVRPPTPRSVKCAVYAPPSWGRLTPPQHPRA
eukprot:2976188-Prymnesium_polylepis.1